MDIQAIELIQQNPIGIALGVFIVLAGLAVKLTKGVFDFYEDYIVRRFIRRIEHLETGVKSDSLTKQYLSHLKENEAFRLSSGINANGEKSSLLMRLYIDGHVDRSYMKRIQRYIEPENNKILIKISIVDRILFSYSLVSSLFIFVYGLILSFPLINEKSGIEALGGFSALLVTAMVARILSRDFRDYRYLNNLQSRLSESQLLSTSSRKTNKDEKSTLRLIMSLLFKR